MPEGQELTLIRFGESPIGIATLENVTSLTIQNIVTNLPEFISFLGQLPKLMDLQCRNLYDTEDLTLRSIGKSQHVVPLLQRYTGCLTIARLLIPGRPVEEIRLILHLPQVNCHCMRDLQCLSEASVTIRLLDVNPFPRDFESFETLASLFPGLRTLALGGLGDATVSLTSTLA